MQTMNYRVRNADGEVTFQSFREIEKAYLSGLVDLDDEILEAGSQNWRKARSYDVLARAHRPGASTIDPRQVIRPFLMVVLCVVALYLIIKGWMSFNQGVPAQTVALRYWVPGLVLAAILGSLLTSVTVRAFKRNRPR